MTSYPQCHRILCHRIFPYGKYSAQKNFTSHLSHANRVLAGLENSGKPGKLTLENQDLENIWNFEKVRKILKYPIIKSRPGKFLGF